MDVAQALQEKLVRFDEAWIQGIPPQSTGYTWVNLRKNAIARVRQIIADLRPQEYTDAGWIECLLEAVRENADTLSHFRGSWCGDEICLRIKITFFVLIQTLLQIDKRGADWELRRIADQYHCSEIMDLMDPKKF